MSFSISECSKDEVQIINSGLGKFNMVQVPAVLDFHWKKLNFGIYDHQDKLVGGILGGVGGWGGLEIKILWVQEDFRGKGLGGKLLEHMEIEGKKLGAWKAKLDTFSFQAKDFYLKKGYKIFGTLENFPQGHNHYFLYKDI